MILEPCFFNDRLQGKTAAPNAYANHNVVLGAWEGVCFGVLYLAVQDSPKSNPITGTGAEASSSLEHVTVGS